MQDHPVLSQVVFGYCPMIDSQRRVVATRLTVFPERPDAAADGAALLRAIETVWPPDDSPAAVSAPLRLAPRPLDPAAVAKRAAAALPPVVLNLAGEALLRAVMAAAPGPQVMIEVPAFMAGDPDHAAVLRKLHGEGTVLLLKGCPLAPLPADLLALFSHSIIDVSEERRIAAPLPPGVRQVATVQAGARTSTEIEAAFQRGAVTVMGWPLDDAAPPGSGRKSAPSEIGVVLELIEGVNREAPVQQLEAVLRRDPALAFRLLRYLNSPAFGLTAEITSFGHALAMLGYRPLKRWLALLLASSAKGTNAQPLLYAAVRRGLLLEALGREAGSDGDSQMQAETSGEMFICGIFSLLDQMLRQPFSELLPNMPVPERVQQALTGSGGPYQIYLDLVRAIEQESIFDVRECSERLLLGPAVVNRAVLKALHTARQLDI